MVGMDGVFRSSGGGSPRGVSLSLVHVLAMRLTHLLHADRLLLDLAGASKPDLLAPLAALLARDLAQTDPRAVLDSLLEREALGTTGIGQGIAIPHARLAGLDAPLAALARSRTGVEFAALDGQPVHLLVALISPEQPAQAHLNALALLTRWLRRPEVRQRLLEAPDLAHLAALVAEEE